jgi:solute carrier family 7 (cationic amino acid transporter), member 14
MKLSIPKPGGGTGMTLFTKLIRTKDLRKLQGDDDPQSNKPKLTVSLSLALARISCFIESSLNFRNA